MKNYADNIRQAADYGLGEAVCLREAYDLTPVGSEDRRILKAMVDARREYTLVLMRLIDDLKRANGQPSIN